jgi:hypothetical protein
VRKWRCRRATSRPRQRRLRERLWRGCRSSRGHAFRGCLAARRCWHSPACPVGLWIGFGLASVGARTRMPRPRLPAQTAASKKQKPAKAVKGEEGGLSRKHRVSRKEGAGNPGAFPFYRPAPPDQPDLTPPH